MTKKTSRWEASDVILVSHKITKEQEELLLTELAGILYDLSCQFHNQSSDTKNPHTLQATNRRSANE